VPSARRHVPDPLHSKPLSLFRNFGSQEAFSPRGMRGIEAARAGGATRWRAVARHGRRLARGQRPASQRSLEFRMPCAASKTMRARRVDRAQMRLDRASLGNSARLSPVRTIVRTTRTGTLAKSEVGTGICRRHLLDQERDATPAGSDLIAPQNFRCRRRGSGFRTASAVRHTHQAKHGSPCTRVTLSSRFSTRLLGFRGVQFRRRRPCIFIKACPRAVVSPHRSDARCNS
jgi:hypothetical protein